MTKSHLTCAIVFLLIGYFVGIYFPSIGQSVTSKVSSVIS